ncbi:hypothetical protein DFJ58DRAFT_402069 [Suillus subalutaceus]|uniref:uncharacterized protein n=1 Tax=Suillus subalutaceus TaxID=48586 RepID=UPI001B85D804|nr:uncharacterized protein DFJ58DRAFT_402069 [Suillus subalutaceus]KAG1852775.1 hypothetical protein DFJ58DRAFT_402069 [Suillus subalutaceus]
MTFRYFRSFELICRSFLVFAGALCPISKLSTLRTLEFKGMADFDFDFLPVLNPIWALLSNLTLDSYEQGAAMRLLRLSPDLSSLTNITLRLCMSPRTIHSH